MKQIILLTAFILPAMYCLPQAKQLDSLLSALQNHPGEDTARLDILHELSYYYISNDAEEGLKTSDKSIMLSQKLHDLKRLAVSYNDKAGSLSSLGDYPQALNMYQKSVDLHLRAGNSRGIAKSFFNQGIIYFNMSDYSQAALHYSKALKIFEQLKDTQRVAVVYNSIGLTYMYSSDYPNALEYFLKALRIQEQAGNKKDLANIYDNLGLIYRRLFNFKKALDYHRQALAINQQFGSKQSIANSYGNMGIVYDTLHNTGEAINAYNHALLINDSIGNKKGIASNLANLGIVYKQLPDYAKSYNNIKRALDLFKELGDKSNTAAMLGETAEIFQNAPGRLVEGLLATPLNQRYNKALGLYKEALKMAQDMELQDQQMYIWSGLYEIYSRQKNYAAALDAYRQFNVFHDSIYNDANRTEITRKEIQFEFDKKEALARAEHEKQQLLAASEIKQQKIIRNTSIGVMLILLVAAVTGYILYKHKRDADEQKKEAEFKAQVADTEMKALRSQMNPHFIFNSLNSISDYILKNDMKAADEYLVKFSKVMRMILENSEQKEISLADDLKALELYMQLEALRLRHKFSYDIKVAGDIDIENTLIPPLILQPFVENSIWHGLSKKQGEGKINIIIARDGDMLSCVVEDNGIGRQKNKNEFNVSKKSLGMKITTARIDIINKLKKSKAAVTLSDLTEGMRIEVTLPFELNY